MDMKYNKYMAYFFDYCNKKVISDAKDAYEYNTCIICKNKYPNDSYFYKNFKTNICKRCQQANYCYFNNEECSNPATLFKCDNCARCNIQICKYHMNAHLHR